MNTVYKLLFAGLFSFSLLSATAKPVNDNEDAVKGHECTMAEHGGHPGCHGMDVEHPAGPGCCDKGFPGIPEFTRSVDFQSVKICRTSPVEFLSVDSVECCVHLVKIDGEKIATAATFETDVTKKRHDLKNILRPVSVGAMGDYYVVLASAVNDSAYVALLDKNFKEVARRTFRSPMYAMHIEPGQMTVVGRNPYGYDINVIPLGGNPESGPDLETFKKGKIASQHYRVAKQSEKIKGSDPVGIGLTAVAVSVVFLALICIALILQGTGKLMSGMEEKKKKGADQKKGGAAVKASAAAADKEGEIYAAIATAIHLYNDELHDEEDAVITIQKVEREWTPWNAKYYNMNQYFNNRR